MTKTQKTEQALRARQNKFKKAPSIDNSASYAGTAMYFRCKGCGDPSGIMVPESYTSKPDFCSECREAKALGIEL